MTQISQIARNQKLETRNQSGLMADMNEHEGLSGSDTRIVTAALPKRDMLRSAEREFYFSNLHC